MLLEGPAILNDRKIFRVYCLSKSFRRVGNSVMNLEIVLNELATVCLGENGISFEIPVVLTDIGRLKIPRTYFTRQIC